MRITSKQATQLQADFERHLCDELEPRIPIKIDASTLDRYVGYYRMNPTYIFESTWEGDWLFARVGEKRWFAVFSYSDHDFFYIVVAAQLSFQVSTNGPATALVLDQDGRDRVAPRVSVEIAKVGQARLVEETKSHSTATIDSALLDRHVGHNANSCITMTIDREGDHPIAQVLDFNKYRVFPTRMRISSRRSGRAAEMFATSRERIWRQNTPAVREVKRNRHFGVRIRQRGLGQDRVGRRQLAPRGALGFR